MNFLKRMGSASSSVRSVSIDQNAEHMSTSSSGSRKVTSGKDKEIKKLNEQLVNLEVLLEQLRKENDGYKSDLNLTTKQLEKVESEKEQLVEQNKLLEEQLETFDQGLSAEGTAYDVSETIKLKDQEISKLSTGLQIAEENLKSMRQKYKTKLQSTRANYSKSKQEQSLQIFELKDEISILKLENEKLNDQLERSGHTGESAINLKESNDEVHSSSKDRTNIIIELSTQISEQEDRIASLENQLKEKDLLISRLQAGKLSPRDAHSLIALEAEKTSQELQTITKDLKKLKRMKQKSKSDRQKATENTDYAREVSTLSRDSGASGLSSPKRLENVELYTLYNPNHPEAAFTNNSTFVT